MARSSARGRRPPARARRRGRPHPGWPRRPGAGLGARRPAPGRASSFGRWRTPAEPGRSSILPRSPGPRPRIRCWHGGPSSPPARATRSIGAVVAESPGARRSASRPGRRGRPRGPGAGRQLIGAIIDHATAAGAAHPVRPAAGTRSPVGPLRLRSGAGGHAPPGLSARPGDGLYAWRGGSAIWSSATSPHR